MKKLFSMLCKQNGAMSLGRVLIFLFGLEILIMTPYVVYVGRENAPFVAFLVFFFLLFIVVVYSKTVDAKIDGRTVSIGVKQNE